MTFDSDKNDPDQNLGYPADGGPGGTKISNEDLSRRRRGGGG